jgi:dTDP-4-dehydrorhamnose 3,5-epimerase
VDKVISRAIASEIDGVEIVPLAQLVDERGAVLHMLRTDSPFFEKFGEIYFSEVGPGAVKAWKRHVRMTQHLAVPWGAVKLVIFDDRPVSTSCGRWQKLILGRPDAYHLIKIPHGLWYGFQGLGNSASLLANCADMIHDPAESENRPSNDPAFPPVWETC